MTWLNSITHPMNMNLSKLQEIVKEGKHGMLQFMGLQRVRQDTATQHYNQITDRAKNGKLCFFPTYTSA